MEISEAKEEKVFESFNVERKIEEIEKLPAGKSDVFFYVDRCDEKIQCRIMVDSRQYAGIRTFILKCDSLLGVIGCVEVPYSSSGRYFNYYQELKIIPELENEIISVKLSILFADNTGYSSCWEV